MTFLSQLLTILFYLGLILMPFLWYLNAPGGKRWLFWMAVAFLNLGGLWVIFVSYLVTRLDGSRPPSLGEAFVQGLWVPVVLLIAGNLAAYAIWKRRR